MPKTERLLSEEMKATADALRHVRLRLSALIAQTGVPPTFAAHDVTTVLVEGLEVVASLERLAEIKREVAP
ncbi:MAG TPA: hypothetical protein VH682_03385 [Gemmataceae bacterium]